MAFKKIYIMLTQYPGIDAKALRLYSRFPYTHASVGLEEDMDTFYTFNHKGFMVESITRYDKPGRDSFLCAVYELKVPVEVYDRIKDVVLNFKERKAEWKYSRAGIFFSLLQIPYKKDKHYFCSQFVAEVLQKCEAVKLRKRSHLYLPKDFSKHKELKKIFMGTHVEFVNRFVKPQKTF